MNGIYVTLTQSLPEAIVVSADQVITLREAAPVTPPAVVVSPKPSTPSQNEPAIESEIVGDNETVNENETITETVVVVVNTDDTVNYKEGDTLYLYYCNPETSQRDFVDEGEYVGSKVTFKINHCSEYVITIIEPNDVESAGGSMPIWIIGLVCGMIVFGVVGLVVFKKKK